MSQLRLQLLGTFQILQNGRSLTAFRTDKIRALLAYLAVESGRPHRRESLAGLFWPEMDDQKALTNLRLSLHRLRQTLGNDQAILQIDRHLVGLDANQVRVDVLDFEGALTTVSRHKHPRLSACLDCCRRLETAVALYRGDFLPGFFLPEAAAFDDWYSPAPMAAARNIVSVNHVSRLSSRKRRYNSGYSLRPATTRPGTLARIRPPAADAIPGSNRPLYSRPKPI